MSGWTRRDLLKAGTTALGVSTLRTPGLNAATTEPQSPVGAGPQGPGSRERLLFDAGWRFHFGHPSDPGLDFGFGQATAHAKSGGLSPSEVKFDDNAWRAVDLPHDWAVDLGFVNDPKLVLSGFKPIGRNYPTTSIGWYRRVFEVPSTDAGRRISLEFDGVYRDCEVAVNGYNLGRNKSGYCPFRHDITDFLNYGGRNAIAVRADATQFEGWWYEGAGMYRHVWLVKTHPLHVAQYGTFVQSELTPAGAVLTISTDIDNDADVERACGVTSTVADAGGRIVGRHESAATAIPRSSRRTVQQRIVLSQPSLWSLETPRLYHLQTAVFAAGTQVDQYETSFGIRTISFDPDRGFSLNGKPVKIKGTCNHQDHAGVGTALPDRIQHFRMEKLRQMGSNAYRSAHNPATPELLDAADRLGMLVVAETRVMSSASEGVSQLERMVRRDRNRPSIVLWSLGNEDKDQGEDQGARIVASMRRAVRRLDPTRPVTFGMDKHWGKGVSGVVDVQGFNYKSDGPEMDEFHGQFPRQPTIGTEVASTFSTRGIYATDKANGHFSAYDVNIPEWGAVAEAWWKAYAARPFLAGGFVWTGFDYRGEPITYGWPCISSAFGILDTCGFPKDNFFYYQAWWGDQPVLHLFPHWNWPERAGQEIDVWCHSNLDRVELFLNGQSLGAQAVPRLTHLQWKVKYVPGVLEARGFRDGRHVLTAKQETAGEPAVIQLLPDRPEISADGEDVSMIEVRVVDGQGRLAPRADDMIAFEVSGAGRLIGVGNGNPSSHESDKGQRRRAFNGLCLAIVQAGREKGEVSVRATAAGLESATLVVPCQPVAPRPWVPQVSDR
jgi:beta-galactosidase